MPELTISLVGLDPPWFDNAHVKEWQKHKEQLVRDIIDGKKQIVLDEEAVMLMRRTFNIYDA